MTEGTSYICLDAGSLEQFADAAEPTIEQHGEWYFRTRPMKNGRWQGEARKGAFVSDHAIREPIEDDVWFDFADTREEVLTKLKSEVWS